MQDTLVVIGASYLQLPLILKAHQMGLTTHAFAWEEGAVARSHCDFFYPISIVEKEAILEETKRIQPNGVISIASDLAMVTVNYLAGKLGLIGNPLDVTDRTTNKHLMRQKLSQGDLPCPKFFLADEACTLNADNLRFPVIVKPTDRSGSRGVTKVHGEAELAAAVERAVSESLKNEAIVEEFIEGREISVEMISWEGKHHPLAVTDKVTSGPPFFVETQHHQPSHIRPEVTLKVLRTVDAALTCLGVQYGASHSELLITPEGEVYIVEIGARMGGDFIGAHLVELSTGYDFVKAVIEVAMGEFREVEKPRQDCAGVYYVAARSGIVTQIIDRTSDYPEIIHKGIFVEEGDIVSDPKESNDRLGYYIYAGPERFPTDIHPLSIATERLGQDAL